MRIQDGCENNLSPNQITIVIVENMPEEKEPGVFAIPEIPEDKFELEKGYYHCVYVLICFKNDVYVDSKEEQADL